MLLSEVSVDSRLIMKPKILLPSSCTSFSAVLFLSLSFLVSVLFIKASRVKAKISGLKMSCQKQNRNNLSKMDAYVIRIQLGLRKASGFGVVLTQT